MRLATGGHSAAASTIRFKSLKSLEAGEMATASLEISGRKEVFGPALFTVLQRVAEVLGNKSDRIICVESLLPRLLLTRS
jgi:hypothetical protein